MFDKVNNKDKEYNLNNAFRPLFIVIFVATLLFLTVVNGFLTGGLGVSYKGLKPAKEKRSNKTSNIVSNIIVEPTSNSNSNEIVEPTSNEVTPTSNRVVEPTSNSTSNEVVPKPGEATYKIVHKYEQLDGTYLNDEIVNKGTVDSEVAPEIVGKDGYKKPTAKKAKINKDGTTVIEYVYELEKYTLTVNDYDYIEEGNVSGEYKYGSTVTLTAKEREHHEFTEWTNGETSQQITLTIKGNTEIGLIYDQTAYVVKYNGNGRTVSPESIVVTKGDSVGTLPVPDFETIRTYTNGKSADNFHRTLKISFDGWYTDLIGGIKVDENYIPESDITLYARFNDPCKNFYYDDWNTISKNVLSDEAYYPVGCAKNVDLDLNADGITDLSSLVVVSNNSTPEECNADDMSQTACGTVFEFEDILTFAKMRDDSSNIGGWRDSTMRTYVNEYIYNVLPASLKNVITTTKVVSGHGSNTGEVNFVTYDKLYLIDLMEIIEDSSNSYNDSSKTRVLDLYSKSHNGWKNKYYSNGYNDYAPYIWTRSPSMSRNTGFFVEGNGYGRTTPESNNEYGVAPLFKIGEPRNPESYHTIRFNTNGGTASFYAKEIGADNSLENLPTIIQAPYGKTFVGWYTELTDGIKIDDNYIPSEDVTLYARYTDDCEEFRNDSWQTISTNVTNKVDYYPLGCTRTIELDYDGDGTTDKIGSVRIANNTEPVACDNQEYSQTSCGFVLEFENIIDVVDVMSDTGSIGSWPNTNTREYVNDTFYNALPSDLKNLIIPTLVYSGHNGYEYYNYTSIDKLYLSSAYELFPNFNGFQGRGNDSLKQDKTRMLDFYTASREQNRTNIYKKYIDNYQTYGWFTRSPLDESNNDYWLFITKTGGLSYTSKQLGNGYHTDSYYTPGITPVFRLGKRKININFDSNGGNNVYGLALEEGDKIENLPSPVPSQGYEFVGWYTELNGGIKIEENYAPTEDMTLYARYEDACVEFNNDSWSTIAANVSSKVDYYPVGCTKNVELDMNHDNEVDTVTKVRIANNSVPEKCSTDGYSQTACGFVLEFVDILSLHKMSEQPICDDECRFDYVRKYLNEDVFSSLPNDLQNVIDYTNVVNGFEYSTSDASKAYQINSFIDKLYLLSNKEVWNVGYTNIDKNSSRQLDYYATEGVDYYTRNDAAQKKYNDEYRNWWLRSTGTKRTDHTSSEEVTRTGTHSTSYIDSSQGLSPAFRISSTSDIYHTITYNSNGGTEIYKQTFAENTEIKELPIPLSNDETLKFEGWYTGLTDGVKVEPGYIIKDNITLYARYESTCKDFATASWDTIQSNVASRVDYYGLGCRKNIALDLDNDGTYETERTLRVINNSVSEKCYDSSFSQTGCGFVIEFEDIINKKGFNSTDTNLGGWRDSELRTYINTTIYNSLPTELKNIILTTKAISGYSYKSDSTNNNSNFVTNDKLYLLESFEVLDPPGTSVNPNMTRQLDFYKVNLVTSYKHDVSKKKYEDNYDSWWLRGAYPFSGNYFYSIDKYGNATSTNTAIKELGISPAFRVATNQVTITLNANGGTLSENSIAGYMGAGTMLPTPKAPLKKKFDGWYTSNNVKVSNYYKPTGNVTLTAKYVGDCNEFENDSWSTIVENISDDSTYYPVGCTKVVNLDLNNDGVNETSTNVRIINNTTTAECKRDSYSQSACGVVLEFENTLFTKQMNTANTNTGGWPSTELRIYLNKNFYENLPTNLKNAIIPTKTLSGYSRSTGSSNYSSVDRIYLLSSYEINGSTYSDNVGSTHTRYLDYYSDSSAVKTKKNLSGSSSSWWLRSAMSTSNNSYSVVSSNNSLNVTSAQATTIQGVSPVFRIGKKTLYYVSFDSNGGSAVQDKTVVPGKSLGNLPIPNVPVNHRFDGWYTAQDGGEKVDKDYKPTGDMTLYARYVDACETFVNDSWDTIVTNISSNLSYYNVGCTKNINLDMDGDGVGETATSVRIVNNSNPAVCRRNELSQTACGFVLEFENIVLNNQMNPTHSNIGGWEKSSLRSYINVELFKMLPDELKSHITPTKVITGHSSSVIETNTETLDMLYLLSTVEINSSSNYDTVTTSQTRTLDYYNSSSAVKTKQYQNSLSEWFLRTPYSSNNYSFHGISSNGSISSIYGNYSSGVSPAFRLDTSNTKYYRVIYNVDGKESVDYYKENEEISNLSVPFIQKKKFVGWYTGLNDGIKIEEGYIPTSDMTLYARFVDGCEEFINDSWDTIASNINNQHDYYPIGCEKEIVYGSTTTNVRIVNNTNPAECSKDNYSESACGFVLEFTDTVEKATMNSNEINIGGWKSSELRNYSNTYIYDKLPDDLKNVIIPTKVISGHGSTSGETNFVSNEYLYLPSTIEIYGTSFEDTVTSDETRQFDLYKNMEVTISSYQFAIKNNYYYFLRSARNLDNRRFNSVKTDGSAGSDLANYESHVSPVFRIGTKEKDYYTIVYDSNGGINVPMELVEVGTEINTLPETSATLKTFIGWYTDLTGGVKVEDGYRPEGNVTLYARYIDLCENFRNDSWDTISENIATNPDYYPVGCTRDISFTENNKVSTKTLRILNTSIPSACDDDNYSQTACGFVLGFEDVVGSEKIAITSEVGKGWKSSYLRNWLHISVYNSLPEDLRNNIIPTNVLSGHDSYGGQPNYSTIDYLYIPSSVELYGSRYNDSLNVDQTRQYDYYTQLNVTLDNYSPLSKSSSSWLRSPKSDNIYFMNTIESNGRPSDSSPKYKSGYVPIFKIGQRDKTYYTVAYETYDGEPVEMDVIEHGNSIETLPETSHPTKTFEGWYTAKKNGTKVEDGFTPTGNTVLYARFTDECTEFEEDSWSEIKANVDTKTDYYPVGCTKEVELDLDKDGVFEQTKNVRIANNTTPSACSGSNYSQTACGFVLEFTDIIEMYKMNANNTNLGGWPESNLRIHLSNDIYNALPSDLKSAIMYTKTLSGYGSNDSNNFVSLDRLYLFSTVELYGSTYYDTLGTSNTRQLDYYKKLGVTSSKYSDLKKKQGNSTEEWWTRSARSSSTYYFNTVGSSGNQTYSSANSSYVGLSPAFRVGTSPITYYTVSFNSNGREPIKDIVIEAGENIDTLPTFNLPLGIEFTGWYTGLSDGYKVEDGFTPSSDITLYARFEDSCKDFATASWDTILANVDSKTNYYGIGCTKDIDLDLDKDGTAELTKTIRVVNNTNPEECSGENYSQTACGFVLEFTDILNLYSMNTEYTNVGGWPESTMKKYLSNDIYNALPSDLKSVIMYTETLSGHGSFDSNNFASVDKLYLLSTVEVYGSAYYDSLSTSNTRQLDYYKIIGVTSSNYSLAEKLHGNSSTEWWLRSAYSSNRYAFDAVGSSGYRTYYSSDSSYIGVSPVFRVGTSPTTYYTVSFNTNSVETINDIILKDGESIETLPTINAPLGKAFDGWYTGLNDGYKVEDGFTPTSDTTLYARYIDLCNGFEDASWDTILTNITTKTDYYGVGCSKNVDLDFDQDGTADKTTRVRIINNTTPEECNNENYSQTACGLVLDFDEVIDTKEMGNSTEGGWPSTSARQYINSDIYDALPSDLKSIIIPTKVVSGYTGSDTTNYVSLDKLYFLSLIEIYDYEMVQVDTVSADYTRQLDYYRLLETTTRNTTPVIKTNGTNPSDYWLRIPYYYNSNSYYVVATTAGELNINDPSSLSGISPVFRIGMSNTNYYTIKYNSNGGSRVADTIIEEGKTVSSLPIPNPPDGMEFSGWYTQLEGGEKVENGYTPSGDITLYARYVDVCNGFGTADWTTISTNVNTKLDYYGIGCKKSVALDFDQDGETDKTVKVRVANNTEPEECSQEGFSQSACGFVIEFDEIIENKEMNEEGTSVGGYPGSQLKTYIDSTIYNSLPSDLKDVIIDTPSVYGHGGSDSENFESVNKLYLLSFNDLFDDIGIDTLGDSQTRQLDYYYSKGLNSSNQSSWNIPKKKLDGEISDWWLATPYNSYFVYIPADYPIDYSSAYYEYGISPAFRLAGTKRSFD